MSQVRALEAHKVLMPDHGEQAEDLANQPVSAIDVDRAREFINSQKSWVAQLKI